MATRVIALRDLPKKHGPYLSPDTRQIEIDAAKTGDGVVINRYAFAPFSGLIVNYQTVNRVDSPLHHRNSFFNAHSYLLGLELAFVKGSAELQQLPQQAWLIEAIFSNVFGRWHSFGPMERDRIRRRLSQMAMVRARHRHPIKYQAAQAMAASTELSDRPSLDDTAKTLTKWSEVVGLDQQRMTELSDVILSTNRTRVANAQKLLKNEARWLDWAEEVMTSGRALEGAALLEFRWRISRGVRTNPYIFPFNVLGFEASRGDGGRLKPERLAGTAQRLAFERELPFVDSLTTLHKRKLTDLATEPDDYLDEAVDFLWLQTWMGFTVTG